MRMNCTKLANMFIIARHLFEFNIFRFYYYTKKNNDLR